MKLSSSIISPRNARLKFVYFLSDIQSDTPLGFDTIGGSFYTVGTTSSLDYVTLYTKTYTIDYNGKLTILGMYLETTLDITFFNGNGICKAQISGDGGNNFSDITDDIIGDPALFVIRNGIGKWINNINTGPDQLQLRILGKSADGNPATIKLDRYSYFEILYNKKRISI